MTVTMTATNFYFASLIRTAVKSSNAETVHDVWRLFLRDIGLLGDAKTVRVRTKNRAMELVINDDDTVTVDMGIPEFSPPEIPFIADRQATTYALDLAGDEVEIAALAIGNPHAVRVVADIKNAPLATQGALTETHPRFPSRVNAGFMEIVARDHIRLRVHERGVGETLGCGSGACAAVVAGVNLGLLDEAVTVTLPGGDAKVTWQGAGKSVFLSGDAHIVFRGEISVR